MVEPAKEQATELIRARFAKEAPTKSSKLLFLTGAGISAESGIPTFRGKDGYWTIGSENYRSEELATRQAFSRMPHEVWAWYLYRRSVCRAAKPNQSHHALVELENDLEDRFLLVTQNVDGLHLRAGSSSERTYQIHGNLDFVRCSNDACETNKSSAPDELLGWERGRALDGSSAERLHCAACGDWLRPHVLWFDECYDEVNYRFQSSIHAAERCRLLVVIGTSGATNLPMQIANLVTDRRGGLIVIDPAPSPFTDMAADNPNGVFLQGTAGEWVPWLANELQKSIERT